MAKFTKGDRVVLTRNGEAVSQGSVGTVLEDDSTVPYVDWEGFKGGHNARFGDKRRSVWAVPEGFMEATP